LESHHLALDKISKLLKIKKIINRIEVYDNSHTFGKNAIGVMIVANREGLSPKYYRKYNIRFDSSEKKLSKNDDYYMIKEVLTRRLKKINKDVNTIFPDLIIIDGGKGQLNIGLKLLKQFNLDKINLISIAKGVNRNSGREIIHTQNKNINLKPNDPLLHFMQRLRDEAHRFAITSHRSKRSKVAIRSVFDELNGIGPKRKKILMLHFGNVEKIKTATMQELRQIKNIPIKKLEEIYEFFHS